MLKKFIILFLASTCLPAFAISSDKYEINLECEFTGTNYEGNIITNKFTEKFKYTKEKPQKNDDSEYKILSITDTKFYSQGKNYDLEFTSISDEYAVANYSTIVGSGFGRKLLVFTYIFDLRSMQVDRIVSGLPRGKDERVQATCISDK